MDGGAWWATVHGVTKSRTRLSDFSFTSHLITDKPQPVSLEKAVVKALFQDFLQSTLFIQTCIPLHILNETWKFLSLSYLLKPWTKTPLLFSHPMCYLSCHLPTERPYESSDMSWDPQSIIRTLYPWAKSLSRDSFPQFSRHSFQMSWSRRVHQRHECPNPAQCFLRRLLSLFCVSSPCAGGTGPEQEQAPEQEGCPRPHSWGQPESRRTHAGLKRVTVSMKSRCCWSFTLHSEAG